MHSDVECEICEMTIGLLILFSPIIIYSITLPLSRWLKPRLRKLYRFFGGVLIFIGGGTSLYHAAYTGNQGGIAAYFFQTAVIVIYVAFLLIMASFKLCVA